MSTSYMRPMCAFLLAVSLGAGCKSESSGEPEAELKGAKLIAGGETFALDAFARQLNASTYEIAISQNIRSCEDLNADASADPNVMMLSPGEPAEALQVRISEVLRPGAEPSTAWDVVWAGAPGFVTDGASADRPDEVRSVRVHEDGSAIDVDMRVAVGEYAIEAPLTATLCPSPWTVVDTPPPAHAVFDGGRIPIRAAVIYDNLPPNVPDYYSMGFGGDTSAVVLLSEQPYESCDAALDFRRYDPPRALIDMRLNVFDGAITRAILKGDRIARAIGAPTKPPLSVETSPTGLILRGETSLAGDHTLAFTGTIPLQDCRETKAAPVPVGMPVETPPEAGTRE